MYIKVHLLEKSSRVWEGKEYNDLLVRVNGRVLSLGLDRQATGDFQSFIDKDCELELVLVPGKMMRAMVLVKLVRSL
jgi:hypothetical protein